jgi:transcriptional regulator with XRE-family HTH domain
MEANQQTTFVTGSPELTELGKRIEMLRIERGLSKQYLAKFAGTSRQQLWRVMTGKSQLTLTLRVRLAAALKVATLEPDETSRWMMPMIAGAAATDFRAYAAAPDAIARTLASMPTGDRGRALKRRLLDAIEDSALEERCTLHPRFFDLRRQVLNGQL